MKQVLSWGILLIAIVCESSVIPLPFVYLFLLISFIIKQDPGILFQAFIAGLFLDILFLRPIGLTSSILLLCLLFIFLYERKFEIQTMQFVMLAAGLGALLYALIFSYGALVFYSFTSAFLVGIVSFIRMLFQPKRQRFEEI